MNNAELACEVVHALGLPLITVSNGGVGFEGRTYYFGIDADEFLANKQVIKALVNKCNEQFIEERAK